MDAARWLDIRTLGPSDTARGSRPVAGDKAFSTRLAETPLPVAATLRSNAVAPGGGVPSSAVQAPGSSGAGILQEFLSSGRSAGASPPMGGALMQARSEMYGLLMLQCQLARGRTSLISNILRVRHDTAKNSISNMR